MDSHPLPVGKARLLGFVQIPEGCWSRDAACKHRGVAVCSRAKRVRLRASSAPITCGIADVSHGRNCPNSLDCLEANPSMPIMAREPVEKRSGQLATFPHPFGSTVACINRATLRYRCSAHCFLVFAVYGALLTAVFAIEGRLGEIWATSVALTWPAALLTVAAITFDMLGRREVARPAPDSRSLVASRHISTAVLMLSLSTAFVVSPLALLAVGSSHAWPALLVVSFVGILVATVHQARVRT